MGAYKNVLTSLHLVTDGDMVADVTSSTVNIANLDNIGIQLIWTGTATGTFEVDVSSDGGWNGTVWTGTTFTALSLSPTPTAAGASSNYYIDLNQVSAPALRVKYVHTGSTGTLQVWVSGKSV